jgi:hypothetical protein
VVHKINSVLLPQDATLPLTVVEQAVSLPSLSTLGTTNDICFFFFV